MKSAECWINVNWDAHGNIKHVSGDHWSSGS